MIEDSVKAPGQEDIMSKAIANMVKRLWKVTLKI